MKEAQFHTLADEALELLAENLEGADAEGKLEVEFAGGILSIMLEDGSEYIINKHAVSREIWAASPLSGAHHFAYDATKEIWVSSSGEVLQEMLSKELGDY